MVAEIRRISEIPGEEAVIEVASKMKTIDELEPKVKDMEARLTIMENIKTDMATAVATLKRLLTQQVWEPGIRGQTE